MRTTIVIPDKLFREAKAKAALEGRKLKDLVIEGLEHVVAERPQRASSMRRASFPIIKSARNSRKITDAMVKEAVEQMYRDEAEHYARFMRR